MGGSELRHRFAFDVNLIIIEAGVRLFLFLVFPRREFV